VTLAPIVPGSALKMKKLVLFAEDFRLPSFIDTNWSLREQLESVRIMDYADAVKVGGT
jgi:hypothetical protein